MGSGLSANPVVKTGWKTLAPPCEIPERLLSSD